MIVRPRLLFSAAAAALALAFAALSPACSNQSEGERCDTRDDNGGNDDCGGGNICTPYATLGGTAQANKTDVCCPQNRAQATTAVCALQPTPPASDASVPDDGGETDTGAPASDAGDAATSEAGADTGTDAPIDSPADTATE